MDNLVQAVWVEFLKARCSKMPLITALGFSMVPFSGGFFMIVLKDPEMARRVGLISAKAQLTIGAADWQNYFRFLILAVGAGGVILFGLITDWVFGREYSDRTLKDLLALPTPRSTIVLSKFLIVAAWSSALTVWIYLLTILIGNLLVLPPAPPGYFGHIAIVLTIALGLNLILVTPFALAASIWRGYLPPIGVMILVIVFSQLTNAAGWGEYFPWAITALYVQGEQLSTVSYSIVILTGIAGLICTLLWWELADHTY